MPALAHRRQAFGPKPMHINVTSASCLQTSLLWSRDRECVTAGCVVEGISPGGTAIGPKRPDRAGADAGVLRTADILSNRKPLPRHRAACAIPGCGRSVGAGSDHLGTDITLMGSLLLRRAFSTSACHTGKGSGVGSDDSAPSR